MHRVYVSCTHIREPASRAMPFPFCYDVRTYTRAKAHLCKLLADVSLQSEEYSVPHKEPASTFKYSDKPLEVTTGMYACTHVGTYTHFMPYTDLYDCVSKRSTSPNAVAEP
jgi:hypothetical protein